MGSFHFRFLGVGGLVVGQWRLYHLPGSYGHVGSWWVCTYCWPVRVSIMVPRPFWKGLSASLCYLGWERFSSVCSGRWPPHSVCSQSLLYNFRLNTGGRLPGLLLLHWAPSSSCVFSSVYLVTLLFKKQLLLQVRADGSRRGLSALFPRDRAQSAQPAGLPQPGLRARSAHPLSP